MDTVANRIRKARKNTGITQEELGKKVFVSASYICRVESGKEIPTEKVIKLISLELNVSYDWLKYGKYEPDKNNATIPMINQVYRDVALKSLQESGIPESLIDGVDCSTLETMEESLASVKNCYYTTIYKHIEETYGVKKEDSVKTLQRMEYEEKDYWKMFNTMNFTADQNKYIANLYNMVGEVTALGTTEKAGKELQRLFQKESLLEKIIESGIEVGIDAGIKVGIDKELLQKFRTYLDIQGDIRGEVEKEAFICGFRSAYHILEECRN